MSSGFLNVDKACDIIANLLNVEKINVNWFVYTNFDINLLNEQLADISDAEMVRIAQGIIDRSSAYNGQGGVVGILYDKYGMMGMQVARVMLYLGDASLRT